jgi:hypothetical protein
LSDKQIDWLTDWLIVVNEHIYTSAP